MTGTPLIIIALLLILGITIYSYFKNGSEKIMVKKELEDRLQVFVGSDIEDGIQDQFIELVQRIELNSLKPIQFIDFNSMH